MLGGGTEGVDQPGVAADLAEEPPVGGPLQPVANRQEECGDRQHRRRGGCARHDLARRRVGGEPGEPAGRAEDGDEADTDGHPPHGDGRVAEVRLHDRRRRAGRHRRPCDRPGQGGEEAVAHLDQAEQPDELHHGHDSDRGEQAHASQRICRRSSRLAPNNVHTRIPPATSGPSASTSSTASPGVS